VLWEQVSPWQWEVHKDADQHQIIFLNDQSVRPDLIAHPTKNHDIVAAMFDSASTASGVCGIHSQILALLLPRWTKDNQRKSFPLHPEPVSSRSSW
jgi:hypothetical protein